MNFFGFTILLSILMNFDSANAAANIVSVDGKSWQIVFQEPQKEKCPVDDGRYKAFVSTYKAAFGINYHASFAACTSRLHTGNR